MRDCMPKLVWVVQTSILHVFVLKYRTVCKQTVRTLVRCDRETRRCALWRLIWICTACLCSLPYSIKINWGSSCVVCILKREIQVWGQMRTLRPASSEHAHFTRFSRDVINKCKQTFEPVSRETLNCAIYAHDGANKHVQSDQVLYAHVLDCEGAIYLPSNFS